MNLPYTYHKMNPFPPDIIRYIIHCNLGYLWLFKRVNRRFNLLVKDIVHRNDIFDDIEVNYYYKSESYVIYSRQYNGVILCKTYVSWGPSQYVHISKYDPYNDINIIVTLVGIYTSKTNLWNIEDRTFEQLCKYHDDVHWGVSLNRRHNWIYLSNQATICPTSLTLKSIIFELRTYFASSRYNCTVGKLGILLCEHIKKI